MVTFMKKPAMLLFIVLFAASGHAQDNVNISGLIFGDYYVMLKNHDDSIEGENAFWFRRIYLTFDKKLDNGFSANVKLDIRSAGDFTSTDKMIPFVKEAYLKWSHNNHEILFGISRSPIGADAEKFWGYRPVERTPLYLHRFNQSRDFGIAFKGVLGSNEIISYHFMAGNGSGYYSETGKGKKISLALALHPASDYIIEGCIDINDRPLGKRRFTLLGLVCLNRAKYRTGAIFARQARRVGPNTDDNVLQIFSVFGAGELVEKVWGFARYDRNFDPNPEGADIPYIPFDPRASSHLIVAGLDLRLIKDISIIPNAEIVLYDKADNGVKPGSDVIPRLTVYFRY